jgi:hypothetical protein
MKTESRWTGMRMLVLGLACLTAVLVGAPRTARAQFGMMGGMEGMQNPAVTTRKLKQYSEVLGLSADQKKAAEDLLSGYDTEYRAATKRAEEIFQAMQEEAQESGDWQIYQEVMPGVMRKFKLKTDKLNHGFMDDLKSLLDDRQLQRFPAVERMHRRSTNNSVVWESADKIDLTEVVSEMRLDSAAAGTIAAPIEQYEMDLDKEIVARGKLMDEMMDYWYEQSEKDKGEEQFWQDPKFQKYMKDFGESGKRIAEVNDRYAKQVQALLPPDKQKDFDTQVKRLKYPMVYKKSYAMRVLETAEKLPDLDATQKEGIKGIKETYERDAASANDRWVDTIVQIQSEQGGANDGMMGGMMYQVAQNDKFTAVRDARKKLDDKTVDAVKALLNEEQKKKLPSKKNRPEFDFDAPSPGEK